MTLPDDVREEIETLRVARSAAARLRRYTELLPDAVTLERVVADPRFASRRELRSTAYQPTREDLVAVLDELDRTRARLANAWREAAARLRRIPHEPTALQGPYWYGQGWMDAIHELEEAADAMEP